jgi:oligopeptidase A
MHNPLLSIGRDVPAYNQILPEHIQPAINALLTKAYDVLKEVENLQGVPSWANLIEPLEDVNESLGRAWGVVNHLTSVIDSPELRNAHAAMIPEVTAFSSYFSQNLIIFEKVKSLKNSSEWQTLSMAQQKSINNTIRDFQLGGAELTDDLKPIFAKNSENQANASKDFSDHVLDATDQFIHVVTSMDELAGLPEDVLAAAKELATEKGFEGWAFSLKFPSYFPVQQLAQHRPLRQRLYQAYVTRASELGAEYGQGKAEWDNTQLMLKILSLRQEEAKLLGYPNYAALSLVPKMAQDVDQVRKFLSEFATRAHPKALSDLAELTAFAKSKFNIEALEPWDITYVSEALKEEKYLFSEYEVKQYFPIDQVLAGLFNVIETVLQIKIEAFDLPKWHDDVKSFQVRNEHGEIVAYFYLDAYARTGKRGGAWMDDARGRKLLGNGVIQTPIAYLVCNFPAPLKSADGVFKPATISHDDVITLFHEFGHGLHHMLTQVDTLGVSGINGVEWDAVELPSQFMENFCWDYEVVSKLSKHVQTGEKLPKDLFAKMIAAKNFQNGLFTLRQMVFALFDWELHASFEPSKQKASDILALSKEINARIHVIPQSDLSRWPNTFSHIFSGGYAAGYYSYKWAEVLSADAFAAFEEQESTFGSVLNSEVGIRYRHEILEVGGSRSATESFAAFRGRAPSIDALLRHGGLLSLNQGLPS